LKKSLKIILQKLLGFDNYLFLFSIFSIRQLKANRHEREFVHFLNMIPNEGAVLDIGANIGIMTISLALKLNKCTIYSFEPIPDNIKALKRILDHYKPGNVKLFEMALGEENGSIDMVLPVIDNMKMQGLSHVVKENDDSEWNKGAVFTLPVKKLDDIDELKNLPKISAIKIDVENFEYYVFRGGKELLLKHKPIIYCELWTNEMRDKTLDFMRSLGYTVNVFDGQKLVPFTNQADTNFFLV
jgi:FkbM family methyltransferase